MGVRSDVAFVICKEDYEALERAFEKHFPESKLLDCFDLIETVEGKGETWFVYVCREIKWYTEDPDIAFLMSCLKEKRTQFAEAAKQAIRKAGTALTLRIGSACKVGPS